MQIDLPRYRLRPYLIPKAEGDPPLNTLMFDHCHTS